MPKVGTQVCGMAAASTGSELAIALPSQAKQLAVSRIMEFRFAAREGTMLASAIAAPERAALLTAEQSFAMAFVRITGRMAWPTTTRPLDIPADRVEPPIPKLSYTRET